LDHLIAVAIEEGCFEDDLKLLYEQTQVLTGRDPELERPTPTTFDVLSHRYTGVERELSLTNW
jgi:hypothetical protein